MPSSIKATRKKWKQVNMEKGKVKYLEVSEYTSVVTDIENTVLMDRKYYRYMGIIHI